MITTYYIGNDIAQATFMVRILRYGTTLDPVGTVEEFSNSEQGYVRAMEWLTQLGVIPESAHMVMEATGVYWEASALWWYEHGITVSVVNPAQVRYFARTKLTRGKTDALDAELLAQFAATMRPRVWSPPSAEMEQVRILMRQRDAYVDMMSDEKHRLHALLVRPYTPESVVTMTTEHIQYLQERIHELERLFKNTLSQMPEWKRSLELLMTIPGVGLITAGTIIAETLCFRDFTDARQLSAYAGLSPEPFMSGSSVYRKPHISKTGNARLRSAVYLASVSSIRGKNMFQEMYRRFQTVGKPTKVALVAIARKILVVAFALYQSQQPFDPDHVSELFTSIAYA